MPEFSSMVLPAPPPLSKHGREFFRHRRSATSSVSGDGKPGEDNGEWSVSLCRVEGNVDDGRNTSVWWWCRVDWVVAVATDDVVEPAAEYEVLVVDRVLVGMCRYGVLVVVEGMCEVLAVVDIVVLGVSSCGIVRLWCGNVILWVRGCVVVHLIWPPGGTTGGCFNTQQCTNLLQMVRTLSRNGRWCTSVEAICLCSKEFYLTAKWTNNNRHKI